MTHLSTSNRADLPDTDYEWMADYIGGRLSPARKQEFEQRLISDRHFYRRMLPFLSAQYPVEPLPIELEVRARVAARVAAGERAAAARAERRRRVKGFVDAIAGVLFPGRVMRVVLAASMMIGVAIAEWPMPVDPPMLKFAHVERVRPTTPSLTAPATVVTAQVTRPRSDTPVVAVANPAVVVGTTGDSVTDRLLAELGVTANPDLALTPLGVTPPGEGERIALNPARLPFHIDTLKSPKESPFVIVLGAIKKAVTLIIKPITGIHKPDTHKLVPYISPPPQ